MKVLLKTGKVMIMDPAEDKNPTPQPSEADRKCGFIPFKRSYLKQIDYNSKPAVSELKFDSLDVTAALGEYNHAALGIYPLNGNLLRLLYRTL